MKIVANSNISSDNVSFEETLTFLFDIQEVESPNSFRKSDLICDNDEDYKIIINLFENCDSFAANYSDEQLAAGYRYIIDPGESDLIFCTIGENVNHIVTLRMLNSMLKVFQEIFDKRCKSCLLNNNYQENNYLLNKLCFLWWDIVPIQGVYSDNEIEKEINRNLFDLLSTILQMKNISCIESAMHGFGLLFHQNPKSVSKIMNENKAYIPSLLSSYYEEILAGDVI